ncbi:MAG: polysaccharide deacetylase family protein [Verrucomicrobiota bacterium]
MKYRTILTWVAMAVFPGAMFLGGCKKPTLPSASKDSAVKEVAAVEAPAPAPPPAKIHQVDTKGSVIVLCYHRFEIKPKDGLAVTPAVFESEMAALGENGFTVIKMQDFLAWRRGEKSIPEKSCLITIDDGYRSGYEVAWPILKKFGYPFTMFIYTAFVKGGALAGGGSLSWAELAEMRDAGVDIQSHTVNHQDLKRKKGKFQSQFATYEDWLKDEIAGSKHQLESRLGISVSVLAYPYGVHNDVIRQAAMAAGYEAAFTTYGQRLTYHSPAEQLGRYALESTKPKIFTDAMAMIGGGGGGESSSAVSGQLAAVSMVTVPQEGEVVHELKPTLKANLATMGEVEPGTVEIRVSGVGAVPVKYDPATKLVTATLLQPLKERQVTVLLSALVNGRRMETRWNFVCDAVAGPAVSPPTHPPTAPAASGTALPTGALPPAGGAPANGVRPVAAPSTPAPAVTGSAR